MQLLQLLDIINVIIVVCVHPNEIHLSADNLSHTFATRGRELVLEDELNGKKRDALGERFIYSSAGDG